MRVPLSWLKDFIHIELPPEEIADTLTMGGLEVEKIEIIDGETIFEISLTPNLGHCMSVIGIARELASLKNLPLKKIAFSLPENASQKIDDMISVKIEDSQQCKRYACRLILNVK